MSKIEFWLQEHLIARFSGDKTVTGPVKGKLEQVSVPLNTGSYFNHVFVYF